MGVKLNLIKLLKPSSPAFYLALTIAAHLALLWWFPFVPTQDGPAHQESTTILAHLLNGEPFWNELFESNWGLKTNQLYHTLLLSVSRFSAMGTAEKIILSVYTILFPLSMWRALRQLGGHTNAILLVIPLIFSFSFHMGFFNLCLATLLYPLALSLYIHFLQRPRWREALLLASLLVISYLAHIIVASITVVSTALMCFVWILSKARENGKTRLKVFFMTCLALLPATTLVLSFLSATGRSENEMMTNFVSLPLLLNNAVALDQIPANFVKLFVAHWFVDAFVYLPWGILYAATAFLIVRRSRPRFPHDLLLVPALALFLLSLLAPNGFGEIHFISNRVALFSALAFILWAGSRGLPDALSRTLNRIAFALALVTVSYLAVIYQDYNEQLEFYLASSSSLQPETLLLPLHYDPQPRLGQRVDPLHHAAGYLASNGGLVNLRNYQARKSYFPIRFKEAYHPDLQLVSSKGVRLDSEPYLFDVDAYKASTGIPVDYLLVWSLQAEERILDLPVGYQRRFTNRALQLYEYERPNALPPSAVASCLSREQPKGQPWQRLSDFAPRSC